jgi:hypothetical protein
MPKSVQRVAKDGFVAEVDGNPVVVFKGTVFSSTDPIVKANPDRFEAYRRASRVRKQVAPG